MAAAGAEVGEDKYRSFIHGESERNTVWRYGGPPNYDTVNKLFEEERTHVWAEGSLEEKVQRLLKSWEMELVHKARPEDQKTVSSERYTTSTNGMSALTRAEVMAIGGYNNFLRTKLPPEHRIYDPDSESPESAMDTFKTAFPRGFAIEVLDVYSGPPKIAFKFRHWGYMEGPFKGHPPHGHRVEFIGVCIFHVDEEMKVEKSEYFYERGNFLASFLSAPAADAAPGSGSSGCPVMHGN
ncbi:hypothetical protein BDA96_03G115600 [Sorghum bicolor]|uniref:Pathogen-related protein n=2 Tax=Sorghum bicolor TaxID=4558 RepID=A0A921RCC5_SORBI|nr:pathogen-related protein-like isoform X2 [Sorghum bicolor]KAG0537063.1 hypothetical protein BDA96_03G115600 [Sorghum bicolor]KXG32168.1 hypothetical protein SORBI_3003G111100 [Sorghum bicolor]|eukprot:XP_021310790.1 pathogen-related protein-like isoform X2 [Sorghum bicolor]